MILYNPSPSRRFPCLAMKNSAGREPWGEGAAMVEGRVSPPWNPVCKAIQAKGAGHGGSRVPLGSGRGLTKWIGILWYSELLHGKYGHHHVAGPRGLDPRMLQSLGKVPTHLRCYRSIVLNQSDRGFDPVCTETAFSGGPSAVGWAPPPSARVAVGKASQVHRIWHRRFRLKHSYRLYPSPGIVIARLESGRACIVCGPLIVLRVVEMA
jgi:hypothetical protein